MTGGAKANAAETHQQRCQTVQAAGKILLTGGERQANVAVVGVRLCFGATQFAVAPDGSQWLAD